MPQDTSKNYYYPDGTRGIPDQTIESEAYNNFLDDLRDYDLNIARPIHRGGTDAITANQALINLGAEKTTQLVTNYDSHVWFPGSFYSSNATGQNAPVDGHAFAGICYVNEPFVDPPTNANVVIEARDQTDTVVVGRLYVREKKAGVWSVWVEQVGGTVELGAGSDARYVNVAGDTMTGPLTMNSPITLLHGNPTDILHATTKQYVDALFVGSGTDVMSARRSRIVNGAMQISQENGNASSTTSDYHGADQWSTPYNMPIVDSVVTSRVPSVTPRGGSHRYRVQVGDMTTGATHFCTIKQIIEGINVADIFSVADIFPGPGTKASVLRFGWLSPAGTYSVAFENAVMNRSFVKNFTVSAEQANTEIEITIAVPPDPPGQIPTPSATTPIRLRFCIAGGSNFHVPSEGWQAGTDKFATAANTNTSFPAGAGKFELFDVGYYLDSLGAGIAPSWEMPDPAEELIRCMRYWQKWPAVTSSGYVAALSTIYETHLIPPMRVIPNMTFSSVAYSNASDLAASTMRENTVTTSFIATAAGPAWAAANIILNARV